MTGAIEGLNKLGTVIVQEEVLDGICKSAHAVPALAEDEPVTGNCAEPKSQTSPSLMARVLDRDNLERALKQVQRNKGAPGIDGNPVCQPDPIHSLFGIT